MPYVNEFDRVLVDRIINDEGGYITNPGNLNYIITKVINKYIKDNPGGLNYKVINDIVGVLECAKSEFYRRVAVPYEDNKIEVNGDVY